MTMQFTPATKHASKLRLALAGPAGSGKTYSALAVGTLLGKRVAVVDTERGSASKYSDLFGFSTLELDSFHPDRYVEAIHAAEHAGFDVLVLDSLSHAWMGKDGALELVDRAAKRSQSNNSFAAWREVTPAHNAMVDAIISANLHIIATLRSKQEYVQDKDERGRTVVRKVGMAPVQRDGLEYEFDVYGDLDQSNNLIVGKTRCPALAGAVIARPGKQLADTLIEWLGGAPAQQHPPRIPPLQPSTGEVVPVKPRQRTREELFANYQELFKQAQELGIPVDGPTYYADETTPREELTDKGKKLRAVVDAHPTPEPAL